MVVVPRYRTDSATSHTRRWSGSTGFNNRRLHSQLDYVPPEEYEAAPYAHIQAGQPATPQL